MELQRLYENVYRVIGSVAGGVLISGRHAVLIDAPEAPMGDNWSQTLRDLGVETVDFVLLTEHRRANCGGLLQWGAPLPPVRATAGEARLLKTAGQVWRTNHGKYHRYGCIPDRFSPLDSIAADGSVSDGAAIVWQDFTITPVVFGARSDGDCAYVVTHKNICVAFCGGLAMADGKLHEVYTLQKALPGMMGYHGYLGALPPWIAGMQRLLAYQPTLLSPAHGAVSHTPATCIALLRQRLLDYAAAYLDISAVRHYFPTEVQGSFAVPLGLSPANQPAPLGQHPHYLSRIGETTSYLLRADSGRAILIDAGEREAVETVQSMLSAGALTALDACWITHYHDDHLNAIHALTHAFDCEILTTAAVAEVISQPQAWFLPALPDCIVRPTVVADGHTWQWEGFTLTALHHPGQTLYHSGLIVQRGSEKTMLCGDSFAPTGFDDYCADNRNLPGVGRGYRLCVAQLERFGIHQLINEHQSAPFCYDAAYCQQLKSGMDRRDAALAALLPDDLGLGLDSQWLRVCPMEQTITAGAFARLSVQVTAHGSHSVVLSPRLPWDAAARPTKSCATRNLSTGSVHVGGDLPPDEQVHFDLALPSGLTGDFQIPFDCWLDGTFLGSFITATVHIVS